MDKVRKAAALGLVAVEGGAWANLALNTVLQNAGPEERDRRFAAQLFYGAIERWIALDILLQQAAGRPLAKLDKEVRAVLRLGLYQLKYMPQVPARAAIFESVELTKALRKSSAAGLVNAVLRKAAALSDPALQDPVERLSFRHAVHRSIAKALLSDYGFEKAEQMLTAMGARPRYAVRVNTLKTNAAALQKQLQNEGVSAEPGFVPHSLHLQAKEKNPLHTEAYAQGLFHVQSEASQQACLLLTPAPGQRVADLCAAPGGKSVTIGQMMENTGVLYSRDLAENRLDLIRKALEKAGVSNAQVAAADAAQYDPMLQGIEAVLCDVPCTGLGTLAKKPDIRLKDVTDMQSLLDIQYAILKTAARYLPVGGRLVYSTCTLLRAENEGQIQRFLGQHPGFSLDMPTETVEEAPRTIHLPGAQNGSFGATIVPTEQGTDGFFMAAMRRMW